MRRAIRILLVVAVLIGAGLLAAWVGLRIYLTSDHARQTASERLTQVLGAPVEVQELSVGSASTTAKLRIFEPDDGSGTRRELLTIEAAETDLSLMDLLSGNTMPRNLTLHGPHLTLRLDKEGTLLTRLPKTDSLPELSKLDPASAGPIPAIQLEGGRLTIHQAGKPDFVLTGAQGRLAPDGDKSRLTGKVTDPFWGNWTLQGDVDLAKGDGDVLLETADLRVTDAHMKGLPFVSATIWEHVEIAGPIAVGLRFGMKAKAFQDAEAQITAKISQIHVPDIESRFEDVTGKAKWHNGVLKVTDAHGKLAGGEVWADGTLNFRDDAPRLVGEVRARGLDVRQLPESWSLPKKLEGRLKGNASLDVLFGKDGMVTKGSGHGEVEDAKIAGFPAQVELRLRGDGKRFRFDSMTP